MRANFIVIISAAVIAGTSAIAQVSPSPIEVQGVTPLGTQRQQPEGGGHQPFQGILEGYVYWDTTAVQHTPPRNCNGLSVAVSVGTPPTGPSPTFERILLRKFNPVDCPVSFGRRASMEGLTV